MPVQLEKITCSFCKETFRPIHRARKKYCSDKCTDDAGNAKKRNKRDKLRLNILILKNMKIPIGRSREVTKEELDGLGFDLKYYSRSVPIWQEGNIQIGTRFYFEYYVLTNQQSKLTIYHY
jgi:hypothetical protein